jgi:hypothetical protein
VNIDNETCLDTCIFEEKKLKSPIVVKGGEYLVLASVWARYSKTREKKHSLF